MITNIMRAWRFSRSGFTLGCFEHRESAGGSPAHLRESSEPGHAWPSRHARNIGGQTRGDDQGIVAQALVTQEYGALGNINVGDLGHDDREMGLMLKDRAQWVGDITSR